MNITNRMLSDLAGQLGIEEGINDAEVLPQGIGNVDDMKRLAEKYKGKSDQEILSEITKIKDKIKKDKKTYEQQLAAVRALKPMMSSEQRKRLDLIISVLED